MQIDWFTVIAEIINFLVLIFLLKYFLYDRIIRVAEKREAKIAAQFEEAEEKASEAQEEAEDYRSKRQHLEDERQEILAEAEEEAEAQRKEWLKQARQEVEATKEQWYQAIRQEQDSFLRELRQRIVHQTYNLAYRALADLAETELEQRMLNVFVKRIENMADDERETLAESIQNSGREVVITSTFELPQESRQKLLGVMQNQFGDSLNGNFKTSSDLICGIELKVDGHKVAWSLEQYLVNLEENLARVLEEEVPQKSQQQEEAESDEG